MTDQTQEESLIHEFRVLIRKVLGAGNEFATIRGRTAAMSKAMREEFAEVAERPFNAAVQSRPHATLVEKQELATWINRELGEMGLTLRCPRSGLPSILQAVPGHIEGAGRFRFNSVDETGRHFNHFTSTTLPDFQLMPDPTVHAPRRIGYGRQR